MQIWERIRGGVDENSRQTTCPTGRHRDGMCTCDSFLMTEESSARASISRIVMLAEALFEVVFSQVLILFLSLLLCSVFLVGWTFSGCLIADFYDK